MISCSLGAQSIHGILTKHAGMDLRLKGYEYLNTIQLGNRTIDSNGVFELKYNPVYKGIAYLETDGNARLFLVLNEGEIEIIGTHLQEADSTHFVESKENEIFIEYAMEHRLREAALAGWKYLKPQYERVELLNDKTESLEHINMEIDRLENEDADYLDALDKELYVSWFLPLRKLIDDMPASAQRYVERIPQHISDFRKMDFNDPRWKSSGILDDILEGHYWLLENSGRSLDSVFIEMNKSTDHIIENLESNDALYNDITQFVFRLMERRSLFKSSEYLAIRLLTQDACVLEDKFAKQLESYRAMKKDTNAPDILFDGYKAIQGIKLKGDITLSQLGYNTTLLFFGSSECPRCKEDLNKMKSKAIDWNEKGLDMIFISLDEDQEAFESFSKEFPWLSYCDFKGWESQAVKDYYVFATPTMFLLDKDRKILVRPSSVEQVDAWVEYKM